MNGASLTNDSRIIVTTNAPGKKVSPVIFGLFFEDINYGADGGLYAELVQNRSFEHRDGLFAWSTIERDAEGNLRVETSYPLNSDNPHYLRLEVKTAGNGFGVANGGFDGIAVKAGENYRFSVHARSPDSVQLAAVLEDADGQRLGECSIEGLGPSWQKFSGVLRSSGDTTKARLLILAKQPGRVDLDMVSLFPESTWKNRPNGLRADLVQLLADLKPGFLRFPGGCIVEGKDLANAYRWKETIGDVSERRQNWNRWMSALPEAPSPHYYQTYGLGFFEYFLLCEDLGAEPVPILNCGMSCQFQDEQLVPVDQLEPYVQDMLDLIEFANGSADSAWGAKRAAMGHPEPFHLKYLGIGNEQWGEEYFRRYPVFYEAIKTRYPDVELITTAGPAVDNSGYVSDGYEKWKLAYDKFKAGVPAEIVDEHYYCKPQWFLDHANRYDGYDRKGPKVFAGEYAAHDEGRRNNLRCALAESALMTGLLRNADVVVMASYAPLLAREGFTQWAPDLIFFNATQAYGTPSYHAQTLFARNRPDEVLPAEIQQPREKEIFAVAGREAASEELILFVVNVAETDARIRVELEGHHAGKRPGRAAVLTSGSADDVNSFDDPNRVRPRESSLEITAPAFDHVFPARSLTVLRF